MKFCPVCGKEYEGGKNCDADGALLVEPKPIRLDSLIGKVLKESYRIEELIGEGGMSAVFRGLQITLHRDVAIKVVLPGLQSTPSVIQRFFREGRLLSQFSHPNVVGIIDFGHTEDGMVYMVMEYLIGATLGDAVPAGGLDAPRIVGFVRQLCSGVGTAHRRMLVHRDLKPDNIFVAPTTGNETIKILDFGIARALEAEPGEARLTQKGTLMGTPGFLAPEQIQSLEVDERSDIYALGALLFFMITGRKPYGGDTPHAIFAQQVHHPPEIDEESFGDRMPFAEVVLQAMQIDPEKRYQTAAELAEAVEQVAIASGLIEEPSRPVATVPGISGEWKVQAAEAGLMPKTPIHTAETTQMLRPGARAPGASDSKNPFLLGALVGVVLVLVVLAFIYLL